MSSPVQASNNNLARALQIIQVHKAFKKTFNDSPAQTKVFVSFIFPLISGLPVYSFMSANPTRQLVTFSLITFVFGWIFYGFTSAYNEKWAVLMAYLVGTCFWFYVFINNYRKEKAGEKVGKKSFVCSPDGTCSTDGTKGPYNGLKKYIYNPPSKPGEKDDKIPKTQFDVRISDKFTYMFWLKIDYNNWKNKKFGYGQDKIILLKGHNIKNSDLVVWALPIDDVLQFDVGTGGNKKTVSLSVNFPFDKWVHYTVVVNNRVAELYKNATLEQSAVLNGNIILQKTPLYLGRSPNNNYNKFPGQLMYLTYNNDNLNPGEIYDIYKEEYSKLSGMDYSNNIIGQSNSEKCPNNDDINDADNFDLKSLFAPSDTGVDYAKEKSIAPPSNKISKKGLMDKYKKYFS
jgi:hypothetical protein